MRISRFYQTGLIFKTAAIFLLTLTSVASAVSFYSVSECESARDSKDKERERLYEERERIYMEAYKGIRTWNNANPILAQLDNQRQAARLQWEQISATCNQMRDSDRGSDSKTPSRPASSANRSSVFNFLSSSTSAASRRRRNSEQMPRADMNRNSSRPVSRQQPQPRQGRIEISPQAMLLWAC